MINYTEKQIAAILYMYYIDNYCETDFSFDNGELRDIITRYYNNMNLSDENLAEIKSNITMTEEEGSDYMYLKFNFSEMKDLVFQVTSLIDFKGNRVDGYNGNAKYADVGLFFKDYVDMDFNELDD